MKTMKQSLLKAVLAFIIISVCGQTAWAQRSFSITSNGAKFTITRTDASVEEKVQYRTVSLTALEGIHFKPASGTLTFKEGQTSREVTVQEVAVDNVPVRYRYQVSGARKYRFEVLDEGGFLLQKKERSIDYGSSYKLSTKNLNKGITDLVYLNNGSFASNLSSDKYVDVSYSPSSNSSHVVSDGYVMIDDSYAYGSKTLCVVPTAELFSRIGATGEYHNTIGNKMYATVCFTEKEKKDGYAYIQILADKATSFDGSDPNGKVDDPSASLYKACFELYEGSHVYPSDGLQFFPHRYDYANRKAGGQSAGHTEFYLAEGRLWEQKFNTSDDYRAANSGSLVLKPTVRNLCIRFDAAGEGNDTYFFKNLFVRLAMLDATAPTLYSNDIVVSRYHAKGNRATISIPFSEAVVVYGNGNNNYLRTSWGNFYHDGGSEANVLSFTGTIDAEAGTELEIYSINASISDLAGNAFNGTLSKKMAGVTVDASVSYGIAYDLDGGELPEGMSNPTAYTYVSGAITLVNPVKKGFAFAGWTGTDLKAPTMEVTIPAGSTGNRSYTASWTEVWQLDLLDGYSLEGYAKDCFWIKSTDDWNALADYVAEGNNCLGLTFRMQNDLGPVSKMMGSQTTAGKNGTRMRFAGSFDGDGHTLTVELESAATNKNYCAPFAYTQNTTIENLHVAGTITSKGEWAAGVVGSTGPNAADGTCVIRNCHVSAIITSNYKSSSSAYTNYGSFVGIAEGNVTIENCWFDGEFRVGEEADFMYSGGFIGINKAAATLTNCLFNAAAVPEATIAARSGQFANNLNGSCFTEECSAVYYVTSFGEIRQGQQVYAAQQAGFENSPVTGPDGKTYYIIMGNNSWTSLQSQLDKDDVVTMSFDALGGTTHTNLVVREGRTVMLDLNGHTIDRGLSEQKTQEDGCVILVESGAKLILIDSSNEKTGTIRGGAYIGNGGGIHCDGVLEAANVTITGNRATGWGGGVYLNGSEASFSACTLSDNRTLTQAGDSQGGGLYIAGGTVTLDNCALDGNNAQNAGGGLYVYDGEVTMTGGTLSENYAYAVACGGGAYLNAGTLTLDGVTVTGNVGYKGKVNYGVGVYVAGGSFQVKGDVKINGNHSVRNKVAASQNVYLKMNQIMTIADNLAATAEISVSKENAGIITSGLSGKGSIAQFSSDEDIYFVNETAEGEVVLSNDAVEITVHEAKMLKQQRYWGTFYHPSRYDRQGDRQEVHGQFSQRDQTAGTVAHAFHRRHLVVVVRRNRGDARFSYQRTAVRGDPQRE